jgi:hypothetical protein
MVITKGPVIAFPCLVLGHLPVVRLKTTSLVQSRTNMVAEPAVFLLTFD